MKKTLIISGFAGVGKTVAYNKFKDLDNFIILDSDSSTFDKLNFPDNYIEHIKSNIGIADVILVSAHEDVRQALCDNKIRFYYFVPHISMKEEFINRYKNRENTESFVNLLDKNWESWVQVDEKKYQRVEVINKDNDMNISLYVLRNALLKHIRLNWINIHNGVDDIFNIFTEAKFKEMCSIYKIVDDNQKNMLSFIIKNFIKTHNNLYSIETI